MSKRQRRVEKVRPTQETLERRAERLSDLIRDYPDILAITLARDPDAEWHIGRLRLVGVLTVEQRDAADGYQRAVRRYSKLLKGPKPPHALDAGKISGTYEGEPTEEESAEFKRAKRAYERRWEILAGCGAEVLRAVTRALRDEHCNLDLLRRGLDSLVDGKFSS